MISPWQKYPDIQRGSIGWRMGYGEEYLREFDNWFARKKLEHKRLYVEQNPEPQGWEGFYSSRVQP